MKIISLGGVGGCDLAYALRKLNQETYPYDWLISSQSFVIKSFNNIHNFFSFDETYVYDTTKLLARDKNAIMLHDFDNFKVQKNTIIEKYKRRFNRLNECLCGNEDILFVRICDNLNEMLCPVNYYDNIFNREKEDFFVWNCFINGIKQKYTHKKIRLLLITNNPEDNVISGDIVIHHLKENKTPDAFYNIIKSNI